MRTRIRSAYHPFSRTIVARLLSAAGTGFYYSVKKPRAKDAMTLRKYDPVGEFVVHMLSFRDTADENKVIACSLIPAVRKHVLFVETKKS